MYENFDLILTELKSSNNFGQGRDTQICFKKLTLAACPGGWTGWGEIEAEGVGKGFCLFFISQMVVTQIREVEVWMKRREWIHEIHRRYH